MSRRWIALILVLCVCSWCGCGRQAPAARDRIVVGVSDPLARETASPCVRASAKRDYGAFARALAGRTSLDIVLRYCASDQELSDAIEAGRVDAAIGKAWTVLRAAGASGRKFLRLADLPGSDGTDELSGAFIARSDSGLATLKDLEGKRVALGPVSAYEKSHAARRALAEAGVTPGEVRVLDGCVPVAAAVFEKELDAGVVSSYVVSFGGLALVGDPKDFKVIGRTEPVPFITFAVSAEVNARHGSTLREELLKMSGPDVPAGLCTTGFVAPTDWTPAELERK